MIYLILFFISLFLPTSHILAQTTNINPKTDFSFQLDTYNDSYKKYLEKQQLNQQYGSLATEKEFIESLRLCLIKRNLLISTYIKLITVNLYSLQKTDFTPSTQDILQRLNQDILWLDNQTALVENIQNKSNLTTYNDQFVDGFKKVKYDISSARVQYHINHQNQIIQDLSNFVLKIDIKDNQPDWPSDIKTQIQNSIQTISDVSNLVSSSNATQYSTFTDFYPDAKDQLNHSKLNLQKVIDNIESFFKKYGTN